MASISALHLLLVEKISTSTRKPWPQQWRRSLSHRTERGDTGHRRVPPSRAPNRFLPNDIARSGRKVDDPIESGKKRVVKRNPFWWISDVCSKVLQQQVVWKEQGWKKNTTFERLGSLDASLNSRLPKLLCIDWPILQESSILIQSFESRKTINPHQSTSIPRCWIFSHKLPRSALAPIEAWPGEDVSAAPLFGAHPMGLEIWLIGSNTATCAIHYTHWCLKVENII